MGKNNNKGKAPKVHAGESFADAVREGTPSDPNSDQNARLKPGESYADAVHEGLDSSEAPPAYTAGANGKGASDAKTPSSTQPPQNVNQNQSGSGSQQEQPKAHALHLPNSHHSHRLGSPSPSPSPGGHHGAHSHPHSHHFSTQGQQGGWPFGGAGRSEEGVVMVPEREYIYALMRARRRFWATLFWALLIYLVAGAIVGGGVADANSHKGKHRDKDGKWHSNVFSRPAAPAGERLAFVRAGVGADRSESVEMPWDYRVQDVRVPE